MASLITMLEAGSTPWRRPWDGESGHHVNLLTGRRYRGGNPALLIFGMQLRNSTLPYWCGFAEARARGLAPRRGCQAVHVLRPQLIQAPSRATTTPVNSPDSAAAGRIRAEPAGSEERRNDQQGPAAARVLYRPVPVFNAADLEGPALADLIRMRRSAAAAAWRPEHERLLRAETVLQRWHVPVISGGTRACYVPDQDRIHLPDRDAFHSPAARAATWAHEAIHSTGHPSRLRRDLSGVMGAGDERSRTYAREELVAELGAVMLGDRLEIGSDTANHAAYLSHWIALLRESPRLLMTLLGEARRAADLICPEIHPESDADAMPPETPRP